MSITFARFDRLFNGFTHFEQPCFINPPPTKHKAIQLSLHFSVRPKLDDMIFSLNPIFDFSVPAENMIRYDPEMMTEDIRSPIWRRSIRFGKWNAVDDTVLAKRVPMAHR